MLEPSSAVADIAPPRIVELSGEIDLAVTPRIGRLLQDAVADCDRLVLDMTAVTFLDSGGISVLVRAANAMRNKGCDGWVRIAGAQPIPARVIAMTGVDSVLPMFDTVDEACRTESKV
jgi:anti-anti-sigma factor